MSLLTVPDVTWLPWVVAMVGVLATYVIWSQTYWLRQGVAQTRPRVLLGDVFDSFMLRRTLGSVVGDIYRQFDGKPFVGIYNFMSPVLLLRDVSLVKEVLIQNFTSFQNNATVFPDGKDEVLGDNPFFADVDRWKDLRTRLSLLFSPARVRVALSDVAESARRLADYLEATGPDTTHDGEVLAKRFTAHASLRVMFGIESHSLEAGSEPGVFYDLGHKIFSGGLIVTLRFIAFLNCPSLLNILGFRFIAEDTVMFFRKLIRDSVEYRVKEDISRDDFVQHVTKQIMASGKIDEVALKKSAAQAINTYVETFETTGLITSAVLLMVATNPKAQDKVREELRAKVQAGQPLQDDVVASLTYLEQCIKETLRLFPPLDVSRRMCTKATTLRDPSDTNNAVTLRPGDVVYLPVDAIHRDPAFYSHPDEFRPEHFSEEEAADRPKCAFLGFGEGPRQCPGMRYAMQQVKVAVATVLQRYEITPAPEQVLPVKRDPTAAIFGFQGGVRLRFRPLE